MKTIRSLEDLNHLREEIIEKKAREASLGRIQVTVGLGTCGIAAGALTVLKAIEEQLAAHKLKEVTVSPTGCVGLCKHEPIVEVSIGENDKVTYGQVNAQAAERIVLEHLMQGKVLEELVIDTAPFPTI
ncbi:MAG TPA: (2Fe-2S) ferredoxin domain-containing protein [Syntrophales bacterium]